MIGKSRGKPVKHVLDEEAKLILTAYKRYRFSASLLEPIIKGKYDVHIPNKRIHEILLSHGKAERLNKQAIRKKPTCRYEGKHSLSLGRMDWHQRPNDGLWACALEDDASRALLVLIETGSPTVETTTQVVE